MTDELLLCSKLFFTEIENWYAYIALQDSKHKIKLVLTMPHSENR